MGKERYVSPLLATAFMATIVFGALFWTAKFTYAADSRMRVLVDIIDELMEEAYGAVRRVDS